MIHVGIRFIVYLPQIESAYAFPEHTTIDLLPARNAVPFLQWKSDTK